MRQLYRGLSRAAIPHGPNVTIVFLHETGYKGGL